MSDTNGLRIFAKCKLFLHCFKECHFSLYYESLSPEDFDVVFPVPGGLAIEVSCLDDLWRVFSVLPEKG